MQQRKYKRNRETIKSKTQYNRRLDLKVKVKKRKDRKFCFGKSKRDEKQTREGKGKEKNIWGKKWAWEKRNKKENVKGE